MKELKCPVEMCNKKFECDLESLPDASVVHQLSDKYRFEEVLDNGQMPRAVQGKCKYHPQSINTSFCMDCKMYICSECIELETTHSSHQHRAAGVAMAECSGILQDRIPQIQLTKNQALDAAESIKKMKSTIEDQRTALTSGVDATFDRLGKILTRRRNELKVRISCLADQKASKLSLQQHDLERQAGELERMAGFIEKVLHSSTEKELLTVYPFLHDKSKESVESASQMDHSPIEAANIAFKTSCGKDLTELCRRNLEVYLEQANPASCSAEGPGLQSAQVMQYSHFTITVVDENQRPCSSVQNVLVKVKCSKNEFEAAAVVRDWGMGCYHVSYCPEFRGCHEIHVSVNDKPIAGSPFPVTVKIPTAQLGASHASIPDVTQPCGITLTPNGKLLLCEWNRNGVIEMDRFGRRSRILGGEDISHPVSLAFTPCGSIYVVECKGPRAGVQKWSRRAGEMLTSACGEGSEPGKFKNPRGMKIGTKKEVFVCDRNNCRIQVFDMNLNHLRCINLDSLPHLRHRAKPHDLAFDQAGYVYITDHSNNCIHKLSPEESYLTSFSKSTDGHLAGPESIAVDIDNYLYVTESRGHRVSVFKTSGECVKAFGCKGKKDGELNLPMGIAIDDCGDIFVCELRNNRIQVF
jgi:tripartite motif-containing protein 2/3/tripartite motif-containing protein 71